MASAWPAEAERAVIGGILSAASYSVEAGLRVAKRIRNAGLDAEHFWLASHGELYRTIQRMVDDSLPVDPISVAAELDRAHADPHVVARLTVLAHEVAAFGAAERYAGIVVDAATRREIEERSAA